MRSSPFLCSAGVNMLVRPFVLSIYMTEQVCDGQLPGKLTCGAVMILSAEMDFTRYVAGYRENGIRWCCCGLEQCVAACKIGIHIVGDKPGFEVPCAAN